MDMKIGFIGAGKVGCSLGKYFVQNGLKCTGYYDIDPMSAKEASDFNDTSCYEDMDRLVKDSDALFLTVPDGLIHLVWLQIRDLPIEGKLICHCSGALSAGDAFTGIEDRGAFGYSIHPLFAVSDRFHSYKELTHAYFTIEGQDERLAEVRKFLKDLGNPVISIQARDKVRYHCAAAIASNHVVGLVQESLDLLGQCGFSPEDGLAALQPILLGNMQHIVETGTTASLTGPVERADTGTVKKHLDCLNEDQKQLYILLSEILIQIGRKKNPSRNYEEMEDLLKKGRETGGAQ